MIAYLEGKIIEKTTQYIVLFVGGIGYKVITTPEVLENAIESEVKIFIYHKSGDDGQVLYGLPTFKSLQFFELLLLVNGVGPKMALNIVSSTSLELLENAISNKDVEIFTRMSGVGKKTAERIILELQSKVSAGVLLSSESHHSDIYDALSSLGYNPREIKEVLPQIASTDSISEQIKSALKLLSKK